MGGTEVALAELVRHRRFALRILNCALAAACALPLAAPETRVIDDFTSLAAWTAVPSDGVSLKLIPAAGATRMDIDFPGGGGYAVARRAGDLELPDDCAR